MAKGSKTSGNTKTQKKKNSSVNNSVEKSKKKSKTSENSKTQKDRSPPEIVKQSFDKNVNEVSNLSEKETHARFTDKGKIELKPCKGSITRILMDEGMEGYNKLMKEKSEIFKTNQAKWREERMNEFCGLNERESDKIPYKVYEHVLYNTRPWETFEEFLTEDENIRMDKMRNYGFIVEKPTEETIYLPLSNEYITKKIHYDENGERVDYDPNINNICYEEEEGYSDCDYSEYEWEDEYNNYESSGSDSEDFDDDDYY